MQMNIIPTCVTAVGRLRQGLFIPSFISPHLFNKHVLRIYHVPGEHKNEKESQALPYGVPHLVTSFIVFPSFDGCMLMRIRCTLDSFS